MEQKKTRFRPTLTAYRRLQLLLQETKDCLDLHIQKENLLNDKMKLLHNEVLLLEKSNELMEAEMNRLRDSNAMLSKLNKQLSTEAQRIASRGLFARIFNL